jgi:Rad3-related DNA helicase
MLFAAQQSEEWRTAVLVDEAHNLVERARDMYSAELDQARLLAASRVAPPAVRRALERVQRCWRELNEAQAGRYRVLDALPSHWLKALERASAVLTEQLLDEPLSVTPELLECHFELLRFTRLAEHFGTHSLLDSTLQGTSRGHTRTTFCLRNIVPAPFLAERFCAARSVTLFSATLAPPHFQRDLLGLPEETVWLDVASPFAAQQLDVQLVRNISTRYRDRQRSLSAVVDLIAAQFMQQPGNYLAFFSSFDYLQQAETLLRQRYPGLPLWPQQRGMTEPERAEFLARFEPAARGIGLVVLGGVFGEGVDLPGDRLIGAFVATLGLPQLNEVNEQRRQRLEQLFGSGYDYAYLFPGLQKVVQAAGRVIRDESDRGVLFLMDDRYTDRRVRALLPGWWQPRVFTARHPNG